MLIKQTSPTLTRFSYPNITGMTYHRTNVVVMYHSRNIVELNDGGWTTQNTARAMNFFFEEQGLPLKARFTKSKATNGIPTIFITVNGEEVRLLGEMSITL